MRKPNPRTARHPARPLLAAATAVLAAALVAGCTAPAAPARDAQAAAQAQQAADPLVTLLSAVEGPCSGTFLDDEEHLFPGGSGEDGFFLATECRLRTDLTLHQVLGTLRIRLEGPEGFLLEHQAYGLIPESDQNGLAQEGLGAPAGTYRYTYEATGKADFGFRVMADS